MNLRLVILIPMVRYPKDMDLTREKSKIKGPRIKYPKFKDPRIKDAGIEYPRIKHPWVKYRRIKHE